MVEIDRMWLDAFLEIVHANKHQINGYFNKV